MKKKIALSVIIACAVLTLLALPALATASSQSEKEDAMIAIESELAAYKAAQTVSVANDGYIGIPVEVSVYRDPSVTVINGKGIDATPVVVYVVNTMAERVGTDSDVSIMTSMLSRGYIVVVFDYLNNAKAISPDLDWSVQNLRTNITSGSYFKNIDGMPGGEYFNNMVVPAGNNAEFNLVYWEFDKHGADGSFDKIVEVWNNDFRAWTKNKDKVIPWVREDGTRKATQTAHDGTQPEWLDENGNPALNGQYIRIKHTKAEVVTDCVKEDGSPIDLNLYMHIIYPTNPKNDVPIMSLAASSEHLAKSCQQTGRPHLNGFAFNGYATVAYDYAWNPLARADHYGYFDGSTPDNGSVTGDNLTYSLGWYNEVKANTAAMRYLRYLSASEHGKYSFDSEAIGVYGNSKGGWMTVLGEENPELLQERRIVPGYNGLPRYENGKTETVGIIDGGEPQPWLEYNGTALDSGADLIYASCGGGVNHITETHAPTFISCNTGDGSCYQTSNQFVNICRNLNVPALWFEVDLAHTFTYGPDNFYGVDTYDAFITFANYYLRGDAVSVLYADRDATYGGIPTNAPILIKFSGAVSAEQIAKITLTDSEGNAVDCKWESKFGNTEWTLTTGTLAGDTAYTLTVPADIAGGNGKAMGKEFTYEFRTGYEHSATNVGTVKTSAGTYVYFTAPSPDAFDFDANLYTLRLNVSNEAINSLNIYALSGFNASSPDSSKLGALVGSVAVTGAGQYDLSLTEYMAGITPGTEVALLVKTAKTPAKTVIRSSTFAENNGGTSIGDRMNYEFTTAPDGTPALKAISTNLRTDYENNYFYPNPESIFTDYGVIKGSNLTMSDVGRTFTISFEVYDTVSRILSVKMRTLSSQSAQYCDYNAYNFNFYTVANEWTTISFEYTVYEPLIGNRGITTQYVNVSTPFSGVTECPLYLKNLTSVETVTEVVTDSAELLVSTTEQRKNPLDTVYGTIPDIYADVSKYPYALFDNAGNFVTAGDLLISTSGTTGVLSVLQTSTFITQFPANDYVLLVRDNVEFNTGYDNFSFMYGKLLIDLDGHSLTLGSKLFNTMAKRCGGIHVTVKNGAIFQGKDSIINLSGITNDNYPYTENGVREFNFTFENVTFGYADGATPAPFITRTGKSATPVRSTVEFIDCIFDFRGVSLTSGLTLFNASTDSNAIVDINVTVSGGVIKADSLEGVSIYKAEGENNSFVLGRNKESEALTIELAEGAPAPDAGFTLDGQGVSFVASGTSGGVTTYVTNANTLWTPYGEIPAEYSSLNDYPFVSFKVNADGTYTFQKAEKDIFLDASPMFVAARSYTAVIYMRRDYGVTSSFNNFGWCKNVTIDLGGHKLTYGDYQMPLAIKKEWDKNITFKNGTIVSGNGTLMVVSGTSSGVGCYYRMVFEDINFDLSSSGSKNPLINLNKSTEKTQGAYMTFNGCSFKLPSKLPAGESAITLFNCNSAGNLVGHITVNGGSIVSPISLSSVTLCNAGGTNSVTFGKLGGAYATVECAITDAYPSYTVSTAEGEMIYAHTANSIGGEVYSLVAKASAETKYGNITYKYASADMYPFVQFEINADGTYSFLGAETSIFADGSKLMLNARSKSTVILMRRDFEKAESTAHTNLCHVNGTLIIDLGGYTLSARSGYFFDANAKKNVLSSTVIFKDGTVVTGDSAFMKTSSTFNREDGKVGKQIFNFIFDGVTFKASSASPSYLTVRLGNDGLLPYDVNVTYTDCIFDLTAGVHKSLALFESGTPDGKVNGTLTVEGCTVKGLVFGSHRLVLVHNDASAVIFKEYNGAYISVYATGDASGTVVSTDDGRALFTEAGEGIYTLTLCTHSYDGKADTDCNLCGEVREAEGYDFELKANLTLGSDIRLNLLTPKGGNVVAVYVNGEALPLGNELTDGDAVYRVYYYNAIAPSMAMVGFTLTVEYTDAGQTKTEDISYSVLHYARTALTSEDLSEAGKALVRDTVGFIGASYDYFGNEVATTEELALLSELLTSYPATEVADIPEGNGNTADISAVVRSAQFDLSSGVIRLRLNLKDTAAPLTVKIGEDTLLTLDASHGKSYVTVDVSAYRLTEAITLTSGNLMGSYSLLDYAQEKMGTDEALDALLKAMYAYGVSSAEYIAEN